MKRFRSAYRCGCGSTKWVAAHAGTEGESETEVWCLRCWPWLAARAAQ